MKIRINSIWCSIKCIYLDISCTFIHTDSTIISNAILDQNENGRPFSFIGNVGWVVVILTILIRLILVPFEFLQKPIEFHIRT